MSILSPAMRSTERFSTVVWKTSFCLVLIAAASWASPFSNDRWVSPKGHPDVNDRVRAIGFDSAGRVYAGGCFTVAGGLTGAHYVAMWKPDTRTWTNLGVSISGPSFALYVDASDYVYVAGSFIKSCGVDANGIARWDPATETWANLGAGANGIIRAVVADQDGNLYVGGGFTEAGGLPASNVAMWNGSNWTNLDAGVNGDVFALAVDTNGHLIAGGLFDEAGGQEAISVARWNGVAWTNLASGLGDGLQDGVDALLISSNGTLYAGGFFTHSGGMPMFSIARWDGNAWTNIGTGVEGTVHVLAEDSSGNVLAGGFFSGVDSAHAAIMRWNGTSWDSFTHDMHGYVIELALDADGRLYVGGEFTVAWDPNIKNIARWDDGDFTALADGLLNDMIHGLTVDSEHRLYAGGLFTRAGANTNARHVARWDANAGIWTNLGGGANGAVKALAVDSDDRLLIGGSFTQVGGLQTTGVAAWDPVQETWTNLAQGLAGSGAEVLAIAFDPANNVFYVGGSFTQAGHVAAQHIAAWNVTLNTWSNLGVGVNHRVHALAVDSSGHLYAGGEFTAAGGQTAHRVARWDPQSLTWTNLGAGLSDRVDALLVVDGTNVVAGGLFTGPTSLWRIARWSPSQSAWLALGGGVSGTLLHQNSLPHVMALASDQRGAIYAGGNFAHPAVGITRWVDHDASGLGSGVNGLVSALAYDPLLDEMWVAGAFSRAGGKPSPAIARLLLIPDDIDTDGDGLPDWWERAHFGGPTNAIAHQASANPKLKVRDAFIAAGDPNSPAFDFATGIRPMQPPSTSTLLSIPTSSAQRVYRLYGATNLMGEPQHWTLILPERTGTGSVLTFTLTNELPYRVFRTGVRLP